MQTYAELELAIRARVSLIALVTHEEERAERRLLAPIAARWREGRLFVWSLTEGFASRSCSDGLPAAPLPSGASAPDPGAALEVAASYADPAIFVLRDFHHFTDSAAHQRRLRDLAPVLGPRGIHIVLLGPSFRVPDDLEKDVHVLDYPPPGLDELGGIVDTLAAELGEQAVALSPGGRERLLKAALGLTLTEAETAIAKAVVRDGALTDAAVPLMVGEKRQIVRRGGVLEFCEADAGMDSVGGLAGLKAWLSRRQAAFSEEAREFGLSVPKGILVLGVQGCGKSLVAKAVSREWQMPLLRLDAGRVFGKYIGESEAAIRRVTQTAEAAAPAVLWIDEIEKGFAGSRGDSQDAGVSARVLGTFLTWLQEKRKPVFVFATANEIRTLPPELLRKGRFDELFFVDLPARDERAEIFAVHLRARNRDPGEYALSTLADAAEGFTGAEIEQSINEGLHAAFADGRRRLTMADMTAAIADVVPLSVTLKEQIGAMRQWAAARARKA